MDMGCVGFVYKMSWVVLGWVCNLLGWVGLGEETWTHVHDWPTHIGHARGELYSDASIFIARLHIYARQHTDARY